MAREREKAITPYRAAQAAILLSFLAGCFPWDGKKPRTVEVRDLAWSCRVSYDRGVFRGGDGEETNEGRRGEEKIACPKIEDASVNHTETSYYVRWEDVDTGELGTSVTKEEWWWLIGIGERFCLMSDAYGLVDFEQGNVIQELGEGQTCNDVLPSDPGK